MATKRVLKKRVKILAHTAVRNVTPPIYGAIDNIEMNTGDILKCLCKRAKVEEILPDGTLYRLNMSNYFIDNSSHMEHPELVNKEPEVKTPVKPDSITTLEADADIKAAATTETKVDETEEEEKTVAETTTPPTVETEEPELSTEVITAPEETEESAEEAENDTSDESEEDQKEEKSTTATQHTTKRGKRK